MSYQFFFGQNGLETILLINCRFIEPCLKIFIYIDNWLNACVAVERIASVHQGVLFQKKLSRQVAKRIIPIVILINIAMYIPQIISLHVYMDQREERSWCVVEYSSWIQIYSLTLIMFHYFGPLLINIISVISILITTIRQRRSSHANQSWWQHVKSKVRHYRHLIISPVILTILTLPHLIISIILDCNKSSNLLWFYIVGYFLSFVPIALVFLIYVLPSPIFKEEFWQLISHHRRRFEKSKLYKYCKNDMRWPKNYSKY